MDKIHAVILKLARFLLLMITVQKSITLIIPLISGGNVPDGYVLLPQCTEETFLPKCDTGGGASVLENELVNY